MGHAGATSTSRPEPASGPPDRGFWQRFAANRAAWWASWLFGLLLLAAAGASLVANDRPLLLRWDGHWYVPLVVDYPPRVFGQPGFVVDYVALGPEIPSHGWALWPPYLQAPNAPNLDFPELPAPPGSQSILGKTPEFPGLPVRHVIGTDTAGRDLATRLLYGCRTSLLMALATTLSAGILGIILGALMGYFGGLFDLLVGRLLETLGYFPVIFMIIILSAFLETPSLMAIIIIFAVVGISPFAYYMRGQVLAARKLTYVEAARALGQSDRRIMFRHILPNVLGPILVLVPFNITSDISFLATIDFLGFGVQAPTASLGAILRAGFDGIDQRGFLIFWSSLVLVIILVLVNLIGDGVRDGLDPQAGISKREFRKWRQKGRVRQPSNPSSRP